MNQQDQQKMVLLYSLIELDGGAERHRVLQHIQDHGYWYKNDQNDIIRPSKKRKEKAWRNDFSYERQHLVEDKHMQEARRSAYGMWEITDSGRNLFSSLAEKAKALEPGEDICFTAIFSQKLFNCEIYPEIAADRLLLEHIYNSDSSPESLFVPLSNVPLPKGPVSNRTSNKNIYLRDPAVSRCALSRAGHQCEADRAHSSFTRKNSSNLYMEPHHLIPMSMTDHFDVNLDREQNIFSLCSNCHNQIHYGIENDVKNLLSKLFLSRENEICAILGKIITLNEIYELYNV